MNAPALGGPTWALLALSGVLGVGYGAFGSGLYEGAPPYVFAAAFKASSILVLGVVALAHRSRLLAGALLFGALGDALLAWSENTFLFGALAFLIGHVFYIILFVRSGAGLGVLVQNPLRALGALALIGAAFVMTALLVPQNSVMFAPLAVYTGVLTLMALASFTLPAARWLVMLGGVLFFVSDGFVAANMFHPQTDPQWAYWSSFSGWMVYWAGQAALCVGGVRLHRLDPAR